MLNCGLKKKKKKETLYIYLYVSFLMKVTKWKMAMCCDPQLGAFLIVLGEFELEQETWDNLIAGNVEWNEKR